MRVFKLLMVGFVLVMAAGVVMAQSVSVDSDLPTYTKTKGVSGSVKSIGSDTMNNLMALWSEDFRSLYPSVQVEIEGSHAFALAAELAGWGGDLEIVEPVEVRDHLARIGAELAAVYR